MVRPVNHRLRLQQRPAAPSAIRPSRGITRQHTAVRGMPARSSSSRHRRIPVDLTNMVSKLWVFQLRGQ